MSDADDETLDDEAEAPETAEAPVTAEAPETAEAPVTAEAPPGERAGALGLELPEDDEEAVGFLLDEVAKARSEASARLDDLQRVAADFDNYRKRALRDQSSMRERAADRVIRELLPVLDTFDAAVAAEPAAEGERRLHSGMLNTREQLLKALQGEGLEVIAALDEVFDPEVHEPVGAPGGEGELVVGRELRRGYTLNGKVVRAALVMLEVRE